uniref:Uncharacterized protein n=1 Tax=Peronospora matthiolae TaxID=2874970 RepID=A0AAV1TCM2_9STRA
MGNALGTKKTLREQLRENKREINRAVRQLDRERTNLQLQEKKLILEIKKMAKEGANRQRQDHGQRPSTHATARDQVLHDAVPAAGGFAATGHGAVS